MILIIKHVSLEGPGIIGEFFQNTKWPIETLEWENGGQLPKNLSALEGIITLGGPMNVYEEKKFPFLKEEENFLKEAIKKEIPILGICLGAQLIAKTMGAKVKKAEKEEIGWYRVDLTEQGQKDMLFQGIDRQLDVFQWHEDCFDLPKQAVLLATSNSCKNQAFRCSKNTYGIQFHIEVTPDMVESWVKEYFDVNQKIIKSQGMIIEAYRNKELVAKEANKILLNFSRIIHQNSCVKS